MFNCTLVHKVFFMKTLLDNMHNASFSESEQKCLNVFGSLDNTYNAYTPENHTIIFTNDEDFKAGLCILGVCVLLFPGIRLFTFELMSNHLHLVISGEESEIDAFFQLFKDRLRKYLEGTGRFMSLSDFKLTKKPICDLKYMRNAIVYTNRNGFVVNPGHTPFSYPWGANPFYFQPMVKDYAAIAGKPMKAIELRKILHGKIGDGIKTLLQINGVVMATAFCDISTGESLFRDARHYFYSVSRNVEAYAEIAKSIGESVYYTDDDLYLITKKLSEKLYDTLDPTMLNSESKIDLANKLHFEYNAGDKQIQRFLKLPANILAGLF